MKPWSGSQMPFANQRRTVTSVFQPVGERCLAQWQARVTMSLHHTNVELMAESLRIPSGQQPCSSGTAIRTAYVRVSESNSALRQGVDVRRRNVLASVHADIAVSHVVGHDDDDVWTPCLCPCVEHRTAEGDRYDEN